MVPENAMLELLREGGELGYVREKDETEEKHLRKVKNFKLFFGKNGFEFNDNFLGMIYDS